MTDRLFESDSGVQWLLKSSDPSIRFLTLTDVLGEPRDSPEAKKALKQIPNGPKVKALLSGQRPDGGFGVHPYQKWTGAHWRLVSLVELEIPGGNRAARKAAETVLDLLDGRRHAKTAGLWRAHASVQGNALGVCSRLGLADDPRVVELARSIVEWQWPDGGWNCDPSEQAEHSSFYESLVPLRGLTEYSLATGDKDSSKAAQMAAEFFLKHRLFRSCKSGSVMNPEWLKLHYPLYWHYDILHALRAMQSAGRLHDSRVNEALEIVKSKRLADGRWKSEGYYWVPRGRTKSGKRRVASVDVVDWGREGPNEMITLNALRVLKASGQLKLV